jgi:hypothetical protein
MSSSHFSRTRPESPKKRAREATLAKAKHNGIPVKIALPANVAPVSRSFDHTLPVKKRPVFAEALGPESVAALRKMESGMPVKKRIPTFLVEHTPVAIQASLVSTEEWRLRIQAPPGLFEMPPGLKNAAR